MTTTITTYPPMAHLYQGIKVSALLRALADVAENHPCLNPSLIAYESFDILQSFGGNEGTMALSFTGDFVASSERFRLALAHAYKHHGGDPSAIADLTGPELAQLEVAS